MVWVSHVWCPTILWGHVRVLTKPRPLRTWSLFFSWKALSHPLKLTKVILSQKTDKKLVSLGLKRKQFGSKWLFYTYCIWANSFCSFWHTEFRITEQSPEGLKVKVVKIFILRQSVWAWLNLKIWSLAHKTIRWNNFHTQAPGCIKLSFCYNRPELITFTWWNSDITLSLPPFNRKSPSTWWFSSFYCLNHKDINLCLMAKNLKVNPALNTGWWLNHVGVVEWQILIPRRLHMVGSKSQMCHPICTKL